MVQGLKVYVVWGVAGATLFALTGAGIVWKVVERAAERRAAAEQARPGEPTLRRWLDEEGTEALARWLEDVRNDIDAEEALAALALAQRIGREDVEATPARGGTPREGPTERESTERRLGWFALLAGCGAAVGLFLGTLGAMARVTALEDRRSRASG